MDPGITLHRIATKSLDMRSHQWEASDRIDAHSHLGESGRDDPVPQRPLPVSFRLSPNHINIVRAAVMTWMAAQTTRTSCTLSPDLAPVTCTRNLECLTKSVEVHREHQTKNAFVRLNAIYLLSFTWLNQSKCRGFPPSSDCTMAVLQYGDQTATENGRLRAEV